MMRTQIVNSFRRRIKFEIGPQNPLKYLRDKDIELYVDAVISTVYMYTRPKKGTKHKSVFMVEIISAIGHTVRNKLKQKRDSSLAAKTGAFLLFTFEELGMIEVALGGGSNGHNAYVVLIKDDDMICKLWEQLPQVGVEKLPASEPYVPWVTSKHPTGAMLVKTGNKDVLDSLNIESHPIIFDCVNKAQAVGWTINEDIYNIHLWALRNKTDAFADIWEQHNPEARATKLREAKSVGSIAHRFLGKTFYHRYYFDFRGRKYPETAYLHEQGSDLARGLIQRVDKKPLGKDGFFWMMVGIASTWAGDAGREDGLKTDKIPLEDRFNWALDNEEIFLSYSESPKVNQGWMKADKPWMFLALCFELKKLRMYQIMRSKELNVLCYEFFEDYSMESSCEVYIDGSNNGSQHLSALTRDEVTAPHVNLVPQPLPGDLYKYVGEHVWVHMRNIVSLYTKHQIKSCETFIDNLLDLKKQIQGAEPRSERRKALVEEIQKFKETYADIAEIASPVFWLRIYEAKHIRKIVKR